MIDTLETGTVSMDPSVLAMTPAASPPPGVIPDFSSADNLHAIFTAALILCIVVSTLVVALRMVARTVVIKAVDWTDCTLSLAQEG